MTKYYKVIKENPMWELDAILSDSETSSHYIGIEDIWDKFDDMTEYLSDSIVEESPDFFERVYKSPADKLVFLTRQQMQKVFGKKFKK